MRGEQLATPAHYMSLQTPTP